jgi:hypothetical protein
MKSTDPAPIVSEEQRAILSKAGIKEAKPMARPTLRSRLNHAVNGCTPIKHLVMNQQIGRVIEVGRICPFCMREFPSGR